jgi:dTDP-4-amino-4,6-dideoxygalactose transaminase
MENNVEVRPLIAGSLARKPFWYKTYGIVALPNADLINEKGFYIPNHQDLTEEDISRICDIIHKNEE